MEFIHDKGNAVLQVSDALSGEGVNEFPQITSLSDSAQFIVK